MDGSPVIPSVRYWVTVERKEQVNNSTCKIVSPALYAVEEMYDLTFMNTSTIKP